jgi:hypothetical protein
MSPSGLSPQTLAQLSPFVQVADCTAKKGLLEDEDEQYFLGTPAEKV